MRTFKLKFEKKFKGGSKEWEKFTHSVQTLFMNESLTLISDTVLYLHSAIQSSLEPVEPVTAGYEEVEFRTPTKKHKGSARDLAALRDDISEDSDLSDAGEAETAEEKKERRRHSAAKTKRNEARQGRSDVQKASEDVRPGPLKPSHLSPPDNAPQILYSMLFKPSTILVFRVVSCVFHFFRFPCLTCIRLGADRAPTALFL